jgi:hypothetical protein
VPPAGPSRWVQGEGARRALAGLALLLPVACGRDIIALGGAAASLHADAGQPDAAPRDAAPALPPPEAGPRGLGAACAADSECSVGACALDKGRCVECTSDTQCTGGLPLAARRCNPAANRCVECLTKSDCPLATSLATTCDPVLLRCTLACTSNAGCFAFIPVCDPSRAACVQCMADSDCATLPLGGGRGEKCALGSCVECTADADCPENQPVCNPRDGRCGCASAEQCGRGMQCGAFDHRCRPAR